jgi:hypothetical protein
VGRVEHPRRQFGLGQGPAHQVQPALAVAQVQMQDAGLAGDQPGNVGVAGNTQNLGQGRLAGPVVGNRHLADADDRVEKHDVLAHAAGEGHRRNMVAAGMAPGVDPQLAQAQRLGDQRPGVASGVVGAEHADHGGDAGCQEMRVRHGRDPAAEAGLTAAAGQMGMPVDQAGDQAQALKVDDLDGFQHAQLVQVGAEPGDAPAGNQQMMDAAIFRRKDVGILENREHQPASLRMKPRSLAPDGLLVILR